MDPPQHGFSFHPLRSFRRASSPLCLPPYSSRSRPLEDRSPSDPLCSDPHPHCSLALARPQLHRPSGAPRTSQVRPQPGPSSVPAATFPLRVPGLFPPRSPADSPAVLVQRHTPQPAPPAPDPLLSSLHKHPPRDVASLLAVQVPAGTRAPGRQAWSRLLRCPWAPAERVPGTRQVLNEPVANIRTSGSGGGDGRLSRTPLGGRCRGTSSGPLPTGT